MLALGIDIGGSGIKGAVVDAATGRMTTDRLRIPTPDGSDAEALTSILKDLIARFDWKEGPVGIGFPGVIRHNVIHTAVNLHKSLLGMNLATALEPVCRGPVCVLNDADAAGYAEMRFGAGRPFSHSGTVLLLTIGTGLGTVLFSDGILVPNLELGHVEFRGDTAERQVAERIRKEEGLSWKQWGRRFNAFLQYIEFLMQPDLIILGGGGVKKAEKVEPLIDIHSEWAFAHFGNRAGIVGAAAAATECPQPAATASAGFPSSG